MDDLTKEVKKSLSDPAKTLLGLLRGSFGRKPTVEDVINQLLQLHGILSSRKNQKEGGWEPKIIESEIAKIQQAIIQGIGSEWKSCDVHKNFLRRLSGQKSRTTCDIFCSNYDTVLEATLEELKLPFTDGFRGAENAYFDPGTYEETRSAGTFFKVYKLHGSINWVRDSDETVRRRPSSAIKVQPRSVIYPAEQKYVQTQYGIYETLLSLFRARLKDPRPNNKLVILGYSLSDEHINVAIEDSLKSERSNLTVYAFLGPEDDLVKQEERLRETADRCDRRFNTIIADKAYVGSGLEKHDWESIRGRDLWKFENLVSLLVGGA